MKLSLIFSLILTSLWAFSQDVGKEALFKQKYSNEEIKRFGETILNGTCTGTSPGQSLYDQGRPLQGVTQQDQDGLNTCYANTASLILKSYNPTLPTPSYLDLASFNEPDEKKLYDFDYGNTCSILTKVKESNAKICADEILENQPVSIQDDILKKLYDVINNYHYTPSQMVDVLKLYEGYLGKNPIPKVVSCAENGQLSLEKYIGDRFQRLTNSYVYSNQEEWSETDEQVSADCAKLLEDKLQQLNILQPTQTEESKNYYGDFEINPKLRSELNQKYLDQMKKNILPSGKTQYEYLVELLNSKATSRATYEHVLGGGVRSDNYQEFLAQMIREVNQQILAGTIKELAQGSPEIEACFDKAGNNLVEPAAGLFFNSTLGDCFNEQTKWRREISEFTQSCHDPEKDLFAIFRNLSALNQSVDDIEKFLVNNNRNILKQIIDNNCTQKYDYKLPATSCQFQGTMAYTASLEKPEDYPYYQLLSEDLAAFFKENKMTNDEIDYNEFAAYWLKKYDNENKEDNKSSLPDHDVENYRKLLQHSYEALNFEHKQTKQEFLTTAQNVIRSYKNKNKEVGLKIQNAIKQGNAVGIATCGSLFSDTVKQRYPNCQNHAVAATGTKCVNGRLKIELTNSWGIGCAEDQSTRSMFECQRDQDGLTNGRAWVDFEYLSDQGMGLYSF